MKGQGSKLLVVTVAFLLIAGACAPAATPPPTPTPVPPTATPVPPTATPIPPPPPALEGMDVVQAWVDAINRGDVDAALALFTDKPSYFGPGGYTASGMAQVAAAFNYMVSIETQYQITECQPESDRVVCTETMSDGCYTVAGLKSEPVKMTFSLEQDGKIRQVTGYTTLGGDPANDQFWLGWQSWAKANRAEELTKLANGDKDGAAIYLRLCKEYVDSLKATPVAAKDPAAPVKA